MRDQADVAELQLHDEVTLETQVGQVPLTARGKLSSILPDIVWVNLSDRCPPLVKDLPEGHPVRLSVPRATNALIGDTIFLRCMAPGRSLVAIGRPTEMRLIDRRSFLRVAIRCKVGIRLAKGSLAQDAGRFGVGTCRDISLKGMRFETPLHMAVGDHVFLSVAVERRFTIFALAQVVRLEDYIEPSTSEPCGGARVRPVAVVKFEALSDNDRRLLEAFLGSKATLATS